MEHYKNNFRSAKKVYGAQEYISPKVVHSVVGTEALDPVLYKANLTVLTLFLFTAQERTEDSMFEDLKNLDRTFPRIFGEKLSQDNFGFALDIRTHALLLCLRSNQDSDGFHAETFIEYFFFEANDGESEASPAPSESRRLRPWDGVNECQGWENDTAQRAAEILEVVGDCKKDKGIDLSSLSEKYPWEDFTDSMVEYVRCIVRNPERQRMFEEAVNKAKDLELFKDPLMEQEYVVNRFKSAKGVKDNKRYFSIHTLFFSLLTFRDSASKRLPVSQLTGLRQVAAEQSARKTNPLSPQALQQPPPSSAAHDTPPHSKQMPEYTGIDALDVDLPSTIFPSALQYAEKIRRIDREKNKENRAAVDPVAGPSKGKKRSFLDRQDGAERLLWDSQGGDTQLERRGPTEAEKGKSKKRSIPRDDDYDDFEPDTRDENEDRRKRSRKDLPQRNQPQPRSSGVSARRSDIPRNELVPDGVGLPSRHYVSPSVSPEPEDEGAARRQSLIQKMGRIDKKTLAQKAHKLRSGRNPWTDEQSQTLVNMIGRYGTNWRAIVQASILPLRQEILAADCVNRQMIPIYTKGRTSI